VLLESNNAHGVLRNVRLQSHHGSKGDHEPRRVCAGLKQSRCRPHIKRSPRLTLGLRYSHVRRMSHSAPERARTRRPVSPDVGDRWQKLRTMSTRQFVSGVGRLGSGSTSEDGGPVSPCDEVSHDAKAFEEFRETTPTETGGCHIPTGPTSTLTGSETAAQLAPRTGLGPATCAATPESETLRHHCCVRKAWAVRPTPTRTGPR
jgi:hypothetical protein